VDWPWEVAERDHEIQNPTSAEKILLLGSYLRLTAESRVLDVACGKGGPGPSYGQRRADYFRSQRSLRVGDLHRSQALRLLD
jgi:hypothetical protein